MKRHLTLATSSIAITLLFIGAHRATLSAQATERMWANIFVGDTLETATPATREIFKCADPIPGPAGPAGVAGAKGDPGPMGPAGPAGTNAAVTLDALVDLLGSLNPDTFAPTAIQSIGPFVSGAPGKRMVFAGGTFTVSTPVLLTLVSGDDAACSVNYRELTTPVPAWPNQQASLPWRRVLPGMSVCLKVSAPATVGGTYTVLR